MRMAARLSPTVWISCCPNNTRNYSGTLPDTGTIPSVRAISNKGRRLLLGTKPPPPCPTVRESERIITMGCGEALITLLLPKPPSMQNYRWYMTSLPAKGTSIIQRHIPIPTQHPPHPTILAATNMTCTRQSISEKQDSPISLTTTGIP